MKKNQNLLQKISLAAKRIQYRLKTKNLKLPKIQIDKSKFTKQNILTFGTAAFLVVAHILIIWAIIASWRYYDIYPALFGSAVAIIVCLLAIIDIVYFVGFNHKDLVLKIISAVLALFLLIGGTVGTYFISKANTIVGNVLDDGKSDKYETFSGVFVCYDENNKFTKIEDLAGKKVGLLQETSDGITYIATNMLSKAKIDYATVDYKTNTEMMQGLLDGKVDAIAITSAYKTIYSNTNEDEPSPFAKYLDHLIDFAPFEEELKIDTKKQKKNISTDPFNVLLIGYSRTDIGSPVGLADSIILATINPQTYTVSMTSIARDSFVPIACYGGEYDKINSGRSTSRACFIETVENFIGMDIDYYMELDYLGLVQIVNVIGGIYINNPVEFTLDGIYVPAGEHVFADGQMALQFARERHHMPNGDFDRQQHQKEVIIEIAKAFINSGDITLALKAMDEASDWMSTDLTLAQLTGIFNLLLNTKNYTGLDTFNLVDFQNSRMTGNGGLMYYSYDMHLPLWVYLVYEGSYNESMDHINTVMGNYKTITQDKNFTFNIDTQYERSQSSTSYSNTYMYTPDPMPAFWAMLTDMSYSEAAAWAAANGVTLNVEYINPGDAEYNEALENMVVSQSPRYGMLVSDYRSGTITVMAPNVLDESKMVPNFVGSSYSSAINWAREYGVPYSVDFDTDADGEIGKVAEQSPKPYTSIDDVEKLRITVKAGVYTISLNSNGHGSSPGSISVKTGDDAKSFPSMSNVTEGGTQYIFQGWYTEPTGGRQVFTTDDVGGDTTIYAHWEDANHVHKWDEGKVTTQPTCGKEGVKTYTCVYDSTHQKTEPIPATGKHTASDWQKTTDATCTHGTYQHKVCTVCGVELETRELDDKTDHSWGEWKVQSEPSCEHGTIVQRVCSVCGHPETQEYDDKLSGDSCQTEEPDPDPNPEQNPEQGGDGETGGENTGG